MAFFSFFIYFVSQSDPMYVFQGPTGAPYAGNQGAISYNPSWNTGSAYPAWPNQPQSADAGEYYHIKN